VKENYTTVNAHIDEFLDIVLSSFSNQILSSSYAIGAWHWISNGSSRSTTSNDNNWTRSFIVTKGFHLKINRKSEINLEDNSMMTINSWKPIRIFSNHFNMWTSMKTNWRQFARKIFLNKYTPIKRKS